MVKYDPAGTPHDRRGSTISELSVWNKALWPADNQTPTDHLMEERK
jgi:hypothetical protein